MILHGNSMVAGKITTTRGASFKAVNPSGGQEIEPLFYDARDIDIDAAMVEAEKAFAIYRKKGREERAAFLEKIGDEIMALGDELMSRANQETGLPLDRLTGERARTVNQLKLFAQTVREGSWLDIRIDTAMEDRKPIPKPDLRRMLSPIGPVIVFGSSNFPLAFSVAGGDTASALAAGNPVIVKAHQAHPGTSELVACAIYRAIDACKMPKGIFSLLHGNSHHVGMTLVRHPSARAVGFTGSHKAGRVLFDTAAARPEPIPVFAEMSSVNPVFILPAALKSSASQIAVGLKTSLVMGVGQFCTKPGLIFTLKGEDTPVLIQSLEDAIQKTLPATMLHAGICQSFHEGKRRMATVPGVRMLAQANTVASPSKTEAAAIVLTTDAKNFLQHPEVAKEVFGPLALFVVAENLEELEEIARRLEGQLTATLHGTPEDLRQSETLISILETKAGRIVFNGFPTGVEVCPSINHGGPYPATTDVRFTSVGTSAIHRFARPICYQNCPQEVLPLELRDKNECGIWRWINQRITQDDVN